MKVRQGFVSNSSTSSFMIYGTEMETSEFYDIIINKHADLFKKELEEINKDVKKDDKMSLEEALINNEIYDVDELLRKHDVPIHMIDGECDLVFLGVEPSAMDMDETKRQFQTRVEEQIKTFVGKKVKCSYIDHDYSC